MPSNLPDRLSRRAQGAATARWLRALYLIARRLLGRLGFQLVFSTYDSPIPDFTELEPAFFDRAGPMHGIEFDIDRQLEFVERELAGYCREFNPPVSAREAGSHRFYLRNGTYESVDAELLYAMVRRFRPQRIVELGSGFSTLIIREALARNDDADGIGALETYDPYRSALLPSEARVTPVRGQDVPEEVFVELGADDLLFVDTSHTVRVGGDVNRIVLDILPRLRRGVIVHFHDIFLPYPYSRGLLADAHFWNEQYLLQAFLAENSAWEILVGAAAVARAYAQRVARVVPSFTPEARPGAFWIRRR